MNTSEFKKVLQGAVMGNHRDLETILELYMPMIEHNSYLYGRLDEDLKQYILIHIALNISKYDKLQSKLDMNFDYLFRSSYMPV